MAEIIHINTAIEVSGLDYIQSGVCVKVLLIGNPMKIGPNLNSNEIEPARSATNKFHEVMQQTKLIMPTAAIKAAVKKGNKIVCSALTIYQEIDVKVAAQEMLNKHFVYTELMTKYESG